MDSLQLGLLHSLRPGEASTRRPCCLLPPATHTINHHKHPLTKVACIQARHGQAKAQPCQAVALLWCRRHTAQQVAKRSSSLHEVCVCCRPLVKRSAVTAAAAAAAVATGRTTAAAAVAAWCRQALRAGCQPYATSTPTQQDMAVQACRCWSSTETTVSGGCCCCYC